MFCLASDVELHGILGVLHLAVNVGVVLDDVGDGIGQGAAHVIIEAPQSNASPTTPSEISARSC